VDCLDRCVAWLQHAAFDLCEVHAMLHVALTNVHRESQDQSHLKQIAENKHQWALAATRAARNNVDAGGSSSHSIGYGGVGSGEKHHGADFAERLLTEAEQEFSTLEEFNEVIFVVLKKKSICLCLSRIYILWGSVWVVSSGFEKKKSNQLNNTIYVEMTGCISVHCPSDSDQTTRPTGRIYHIGREGNRMVGEKRGE
jgi:hypothetical protein